MKYVPGFSVNFFGGNCMWWREIVDNCHLYHGIIFANLPPFHIHGKLSHEKTLNRYKVFLPQKLLQLPFKLWKSLDLADGKRWKNWWWWWWWSGCQVFVRWLHTLIFHGFIVGLPILHTLTWEESTCHLIRKDHLEVW